MVIASLVLQDPTDLIPKQGDNPWIWATGVLLVLAAFLGREILKDRDDWRDQAKASTAALAANTEVLAKARDLVADMHKGNEDLTREVRGGMAMIERNWSEFHRGQDRAIAERESGRAR